MAKTYSQQLSGEQKRILSNIMFAEVGGGPVNEAHAVASTFLNNVDQKGFDKAVRMSSAYVKRSPQYQRADTGGYKKSMFEQGAFLRNQALVDNLIQDPAGRGPFTNFENVQAYGEPDWAHAATQAQDIGRQRFYVIPQTQRARIVSR